MEHLCDFIASEIYVNKRCRDHNYDETSYLVKKEADSTYFLPDAATISGSAVSYFLSAFFQSAKKRYLMQEFKGTTNVYLCKTTKNRHFQVQLINTHKLHSPLD